MVGTSAISWSRAIVLSVLAIYAPFVVAASYALMFVSSSHAKLGMWKLLPCAPGLAPVEGLLQFVGLPRLGDSVSFALALVFTFVVVGLLAALGRRGKWLRWVSLVVTLILSGVSAFSVLSMLQS